MDNEYKTISEFATPEEVWSQQKIIQLDQTLEFYKEQIDMFRISNREELEIRLDGCILKLIR
jgi:hypothetical protein